MKFALAIAVAIFGNFLKVEGHVSLTFPPARKYDLDFLDTARQDV